MVYRWYLEDLHDLNNIDNISIIFSMITGHCRLDVKIWRKTGQIWRRIWKKLGSAEPVEPVFSNSAMTTFLLDIAPPICDQVRWYTILLFHLFLDYEANNDTYFINYLSMIEAKAIEYFQGACYHILVPATEVQETIWLVSSIDLLAIYRMSEVGSEYKVWFGAS